MSNRKHFSPGALTAPLPPAIVTVGDGERDNMLTVAWTGILATVPPKTYISVRPSRHSHALLRECGEFVINLPTADMARTVDFVGIYTGAKMDKFERTGLTRAPSERVKAPTVSECPIALECRVTEVLPMGSHDVFIADIISVSCDGSLLDSEGKLHFERANLLAYMHGEYYSLGECLGKFGFSTKKDGKGAGAAVVKKAAAVDSENAGKGAKREPTAAAEKKQAEGTEKAAPFYVAVAGKRRSSQRKGGSGKRNRSNKR